MGGLACGNACAGPDCLQEYSRERPQPEARAVRGPKSSTSIRDSAQEKRRAASERTTFWPALPHPATSSRVLTKIRGTPREPRLDHDAATYCPYHPSRERQALTLLSQFLARPDHPPPGITKRVDRRERRQATRENRRSPWGTPEGEDRRPFALQLTRVAGRPHPTAPPITQNRHIFTGPNQPIK